MLTIRRPVPLFCLTLLLAALTSSAAFAQDISINLGQGTGVNERVIQLLGLLTVLSVAPSILIMITSFVRIAVVLSILRTAIGTQSAPPNAVIIGLSLFLTAFVMAPTFQTVYDNAVRPLMANEIEIQQAYERATPPLRDFMLKQARKRTLPCFLTLPRRHRPPRLSRSACACSSPPS